MWGDPRSSNRMDPFSRSQDERFASGWNRDFLARSDGLALERNAGVFQSGRDPYRPLEFAGMLGPSGRQFAGREAAPFSFATRGLPIDFRAGDRMAHDLAIRDLQARELASLDFRVRDAMTSEFRSREMHPIDYRIREELMMEYRERDKAALDFRNRMLPPLDFKDRGVPHLDYRERELLDFRSREAPPEFRGRDMLDIDFRNKEQSHTELRESNVSDIDFRNRNQLLSDFRGKEVPHSDFLGTSSSPVDFRGKEGSQLDFRARDLPHSDFNAPGSSDLDMRDRDTAMFNFQSVERSEADQDFRERNVAETPMDIPDRLRLPPNQQLVDYVQSQPTVLTPEREVHEDRLNKTEDPALGSSLYSEEQQINSQPRDEQSCELPPDTKNSDGNHNINTAEDVAAESPRQPLTAGEQLRTPPGRGVKRGADLDFLGRQDTDYRNMDYRDVDLRFDYSHGKAHAQERSVKEPRPDLQMGKSGRSVAKSSKIGESSASHATLAKEEQAARASEENFDEFVQRVSTAVNAALDPKITKVADVDQDYRHASTGEECASRFIQIHGLPADTDKKEVIEAIRSSDEKPIEDLQLSDYNPGYSNDSVCVEFPLLEQAIGCMESNQGSLFIGGREVTLTYAPDPTDWFCEKCKAINVFSGGICDQCNTSRYESDAICKQRSSRIKASPRRSSSPPSRGKDSERRRREKERRHQGYENFQAELRKWEYDDDDGTHRHQQYDQDEDDDDNSHDNSKSKDIGYRPVCGFPSKKIPGSHGNYNLHRSKISCLTCFQNCAIIGHCHHTYMMIRPVFGTTTQEIVVKAFAPIVHLSPENVRIIHKRSRGKLKSYGFIDMQSHEEVLRVIGILATRKPPVKIEGKYVNGIVANHKPCGHRPAKKRKQPIWLSPGFSLQTAKRSIYVQNKRSGRSRSTGDSDENEADDSSFVYDPDTGYYVDPLSGMCYDPETKTEFPVGEKPDPSKAVENRRDAREEKSAYSRDADRKRHSSPDGQKKRSDSYDREKSRDRAEQKRKERFRSPPLSKHSKNKARDRGRRSNSEQKDDTERWHAEKKVSRPRKAVFTEKDDSEDETPTTEDPFKKPLLPVMKKKEMSPPPPSPPAPALASAPAPVPVPAPPPVVNPLMSLLGEYGGDSENEEEEEEPPPPPPPRKVQPPSPPPPPPPPIPPKNEESNEDKLTDWSKLACLLCKRQFPTKEGLIRHQQLSELHQQNLVIHRRIKQSEKELEYLEMKEREVKQKEKGSEKKMTSQVSPEKKRPKHSRTAQRDIDSTSKSEFENDNKVKRTQQTTVKKRGRPGRNQHDRKSPEEGEDEDQGSQARPYKRLPHESYRDAARKVMFARFKELM